MISVFARKARASAVWLRVLLVAAMVMSAFAHRAAVAEPTAIELAQYVLPDGTVPDLCDPVSGGDAGHVHVVCDFCLIAGSAAPAQPVAPTLASPLPVVLAVVLPPRAAPPVTPVALATASKRGPPLCIS
ncbi:MAG: hypothetical protein CL535_20265 [Ahrensia sp.]|nr:hypothetical protein [Ahrensia sp.]|tara:strand:- start:14287 stop:14676 length:390 start_codon:yes stop_codon:yes gene_type:complete